MLAPIGPLRAALLAAAIATAPPSSFAQQCRGETIPLSSPSRVITGAALVEDHVLVTESSGFPQPEARVLAYRFDPTLGEYVLDDSIQSPLWAPNDELMDVVSDGSTAVILPYSFPGPVSLEIIEPTATGGWTLQSVPVGETDGLALSRTAAVDGDYAVALTTLGFLQPLHLTVVERGVNGTWAVVETVSTRVINAGFNVDNLSCVALDGSVAAFTQSSLLTQTGNVVVVERMANGAWIETANLPSTSSLTFPVGRTAIDVSGDRIAVVRSAAAVGSFDLEVTIYLRSQPGVWGIAQQFIVPSDGTAVPFGPRAGVTLDRRRLALNRDSVTDLYTLDGAGQFVLDQRVQGLNELVSFQDGTILGVDALNVKVVDVGPGTPVRSTVCR